MNIKYRILNDEFIENVLEEVKLSYNSKFDLEERLVNFATLIVNLSDTIKGSGAGVYLKNQIIRSGIAPALIYAESLSAESRKDFIHKLKLALKELRETSVSMKILLKSNLVRDEKIALSVQDEVHQLIAIFVKSIETAQSRLQQK